MAQTKEVVKPVINQVELQGTVVWSAEKELEKSVMYTFIVGVSVPNQKFTHNFICKQFNVGKKDKLFVKGDKVHLVGSLQVNSWKRNQTDKEYQHETYIKVSNIAEIKDELPF